MKFLWDTEPVFCFTSDVDWASDQVLEYSHNKLSGNNLKITYFNTHFSKFIDDLSQKKISRQLIHPNFLPNSSQGNTFSEVIEYCLNLVPDADGLRTHRYFEVNDVMDDFAKRGFKFFSNHCLRCEPNITPLHHRSGMVSLPIFFEDGCFLKMSPSLDKTFLEKRLNTPGLKIINFHAAHMAFNTPNFDFTRNIKDSMTREKWNNIDIKEINYLSYDGFGIRNILEFIVNFISKFNFKIKTISEISNEFILSREIQI